MEDLWYLVQSNIEDQAYQIQHILANKLDNYKEWGNQYIDDNIQEIQELYKDREQKKKNGKVEKEEVILIKPYKILATTSSNTTELSFIHDAIKNLEWHMKFIHSPTQTKLFKLPPYYQSLYSREEQDSKF